MSNNEQLGFVDRTPEPSDKAYRPSADETGNISSPNNNTNNNDAADSRHTMLDLSSVDAAAGADDASAAAATATGGEGFFGRVSNFVARAKAFKEDKVKSLRPWSEFLERDKFSTPGKMEAFSRINKNVSYFHSNYVVLLFLISIYVFVTNLAFTISMSICAGAYLYFRMKSATGEPVVIAGREVSSTQFYTMFVVATLVLFYSTNGSSTVFWLVTTAAVVVLGHAATREPIEQPKDIFSFSF